MSAFPTPESHGFTLYPVAPRDFVGRERQFHDLVEPALMDSPRLVSLTGPSKIGRTSFLLKLQALTRQEGKGTSLEPLFVGTRRVVTPYINLERHPQNTTIRQTVVDAIAQEMKEHELETPPADELRGVAAMDALLPFLVGASGHAVFLPLIDGAERLLQDDGEESTDEWYGGALMELGRLNDAVRHFGVVLSFGLSGPVGQLDPLRRLERRERTISTISHFLNRMADMVELGFLSREEVTRFAKTAQVPLSVSNRGPLHDADVEWIAGIAEGHPYVVNCAGMHAYKRRARDADIADIEAEVVQGLELFMIRLIKRLEHVPDALAAARALASSDAPMELPDAIGLALTREGLAIVEGEVVADAVRVRIPSRAIRSAILRFVGVPSHTGPRAASPPKGAFAASLVGPDGVLRRVSLTTSEHALIERLRSAPSGTVVTSGQMRAALGDEVTTKQLVQRVSVVRGKLCDALGMANPIRNVYGEGYMWIGDPALELNRGRGSPSRQA